MGCSELNILSCSHIIWIGMSDILTDIQKLHMIPNTNMSYEVMCLTKVWIYLALYHTETSCVKYCFCFLAIFN